MLSADPGFYRVEESYIKKKSSLPGGRPLGRKASIHPALQAAGNSNIKVLSAWWKDQEAARGGLHLPVLLLLFLHECLFLPALA